MLGYHDKLDITNRAWRNLWFHTGDVGRQDEAGSFYYVDRHNDALRRRGENIASFEVERTIAAHPAVVDCAVVGVPGDLGDEDVKAVVQLKADHALSPEDLVL